MEERCVGGVDAVNGALSSASDVGVESRSRLSSLRCRSPVFMFEG